MNNKDLSGIPAVFAAAACASVIFVALSASADTTPALEIIRKKYNLPALAVVVVKDGHISERAAAGVRKAGDPTPVTLDDIYHIGSCTKPMTATLTAMLIEKGVLRWDTRIAEAFPELKDKMNRQYEAVTVEQLLSHRGGVPAEPPEAAWKQAWEQKGSPVEQRREFIEAILRESPEAVPGTKMIYSNQGYAILGGILEKVTGVPWETLITETLFKPLHMDSAGFGPPGKKNAVVEPWGHVRKLSEAVPIQEDNPPAIASAARVHCSLDDLARFAIFHLGAGPATGLLKPETISKLHTPLPGDDYASGWVVLQRDWAGRSALMHNGSNTMWYTVMWLAPEKRFAVIVATNISGSGAEQGCDDVAAEMIQSAFGKQ